MSAEYRLFERQWKRGSADEDTLERAVELGYITEEEKEEIMDHEQDGD
ncbi:XkdX-like protein [Salsuginibacillus halophilus]|uniref:XkdX-like protein n=1 Tax=Salsuginibacillus halophilus TaxID=517424 RepID=A0A2P8H653_9BACI|nr:XkdX family protein [Salsuginibacillus halophilus]PSL41696.1 XkdX-like protein [Salsuginibacillus halophilus]